MRRAARALALGLALTAVLAACSTATSGTAPTPSGTESGSTTATTLAAGEKRTVQSGSVAVVVTLTELTDRGARFTVVMDNHEREVTADPSRVAALTVAGSAWSAPTWQVDESTGHHLSGSLWFPAPSEAATAGPVQLTIDAAPDGLPEAVTLSWER